MGKQGGKAIAFVSLVASFVWACLLRVVVVMELVLRSWCCGYGREVCSWLGSGCLAQWGYFRKGYLMRVAKLAISLPTCRVQSRLCCGMPPFFVVLGPYVLPWFWWLGCVFVCVVACGHSDFVIGMWFRRIRKL